MLIFLKRWFDNMRRRFYGFPSSGTTVVPPPPPPPTLLAPVNSSLPAIAGAAVKGQTLTVSTGAWLNSTTGFTYDWKRGGASIGVFGSSYVLVTADIGSVITCTVTASNAAGSTPATSAGTTTIIDLAPINTALPIITGTATEGQTLSVSSGTWVNTPITYAYQWLRNGSATIGATAATYLLVTADVGGLIGCTVTAVNSGGSVSATSASVGPIGAATATPHNTVLPVLTGAAIVGQRLFTGNGSWDIAPTSYTYQWYTELGIISGETNDNYLTADIDVGRQIHCAVTAYNIAAASAPASSAATSAVANIDLSGDAPVLVRTTASGVTPVHWDTTLGSNTFAGYHGRLQIGSAGAFTTILQDVVKELTTADLASGATIDWTAATPPLTSIGATDGIRMRVETQSPLGVPYESGWSNVISPTDTAWIPTNIGSTQFWLEADTTKLWKDTAGTLAVTADGDLVQRIDNKGGTGYFTILTGTCTYKTGAGKPYLDFAACAFVLHGAGVVVTDGSGQHSSGASVYVNAIAAAELIWDADNSSSSPRLSQFLKVDADGTTRTIAFNAAGSVFQDTAAAVVAATPATLIEVTTTAITEMFKDNVSNGSTAVTGAMQASAVVPALGGNNYASINSLFSGRLYSLVHCAGTITSTERGNLHTYLAGKHP